MSLFRFNLKVFLQSKKLFLVLILPIVLLTGIWGITSYFEEDRLMTEATVNVLYKLDDIYDHFKEEGSPDKLRAINELSNTLRTLNSSLSVMKNDKLFYQANTTILQQFDIVLNDASETDRLSLAVEREAILKQQLFFKHLGNHGIPIRLEYKTYKMIEYMIMVVLVSTFLFLFVYGMNELVLYVQRHQALFAVLPITSSKLVLEQLVLGIVLLLIVPIFIYLLGMWGYVMMEYHFNIFEFPIFVGSYQQFMFVSAGDLFISAICYQMGIAVLVGAILQKLHFSDSAFLMFLLILLSCVPYMLQDVWVYYLPTSWMQFWMFLSG